MRRGLLPWAAVLALLAAAAVLALLADAVFASGDELDAPAEATIDQGFRSRVARSLLGTGAELELASALERFDRTRVAELDPQERLAAHGEIEADLARAAGGDASADVRSRAANLSGVLLVEDARLSPSSASRFLQLGLESFREAVKLDPGNDAAAYNLELLVGLLARGEGTIGRDSGSEGASGAGSGAETTGY